MSIAEYLNNDKKYFAHKDGVSIPIETIQEHSSLVLQYAKKIIEVQNLNPIIHNIGKQFFESDSDGFLLWEQMFFDTIYLHDLGKANTDFQSLKMGNKEFKNSQNRNSEHSILSASLYFSKYFNLVKTRNDKNNFLPFMFINSYIISRHHGYLNTFAKFLEDFADTDKIYRPYAKLLEDISIDFSIMNKEKILENLETFTKNKISDFENSEKFKTINLYIYTKLLYSLLVSSDFYATSEYMNGFKAEKPEDFRVITDVNKFLEPFSKTGIYQSIQKYSKNRKQDKFTDINEARSEMFLEAEENLLKHLEKNLFYLEAPTGSGKTNTAINLSLQIVKNCPNINKIFYVFPFNTLVEQTKNTLLKSFGEEIGNEIGIINSITPIFEEDETDGKTNKVKDEKGNTIKKIDYNSILLGRQFLHYPIVVTTHVKLFDWLFGIGRESHFPLCQLANSVVILDEIQSYKNSIWKEIAIFLQKFSELLNIKVIIMSATLPKIDKLIPDKKNTVENIFQDLISDRNKYFNCPFFKNRVIPNFDLIDELKNLDEDEKINILQGKIFEQHKSGKDVLVEFINKKRSLEFFKSFKERYSTNNSKSFVLINGDDNLYTRNKIISEVKNPDRDYNIILFSTQVIEAGVDIDLDIGFKDISILDAEEQFMGRINRSCKKQNCIVYFFNLDDMAKIYKKDKRNDLTLEKQEVRKYLTNKDFGNFYEKIISELAQESYRNTPQNFEQFRESTLQTLDFKGIQERLKLLKDDNSYTIFLNREIKTDKETLVGCEVWQKYKNILNKQIDEKYTYAQKQIEISQINKALSYFMYSVRKLNQTYNDLIGDIYYYENGEDFFTEDGKFDRVSFEGEHDKVNYEIL